MARQHYTIAVLPSLIHRSDDDPHLRIFRGPTNPSVLIHELATYLVHWALLIISALDRPAAH